MKIWLFIAWHWQSHVLSCHLIVSEVIKWQTNVKSEGEHITQNEQRVFGGIRMNRLEFPPRKEKRCSTASGVAASPRVSWLSGWSSPVSHLQCTWRCRLQQQCQLCMHFWIWLAQGQPAWWKGVEWPSSKPSLAGKHRIFPQIICSSRRLRMPLPRDGSVMPLYTHIPSEILTCIERSCKHDVRTTAWHHREMCTRCGTGGAASP